MYVRDGGADGVYVRRSECGEEEQDGEQAAVAVDVRRFGRGRCGRCTAAACAQLERGRAMDDANDEREATALRPRGHGASSHSRLGRWSC